MRTNKIKSENSEKKDETEINFGNNDSENRNK